MRRPPRKRHLQLTLDQARKPDGRHGGWRPGAGRPKKRGAVSHDTRPDEPSRFPQHVTLRIADAVPSLARAAVLKVIRQAIRDSQKIGPAHETSVGRTREAKVESTRDPRHARRTRAAVARAQSTAGGFRIVEFNVLGNHVHLVTEADGKAALASGVAGFEVRVAQRVNALLGRRGKLFPQRYHARHLKTPREVRNALRYVLLNRKHHAAEQRFTRTWIDPCSSAVWFAGWAQPVRADEPWKRELIGLPQPTAPPETWLLATGWKRHGLLRFDERPG